MFPTGNGVRKRVVKLLETVKEAEAVELKEAVKGRTVEQHREFHSDPRQSVKPEWANNLPSWTAKE